MLRAIGGLVLISINLITPELQAQTRPLPQLIDQARQDTVEGDQAQDRINAIDDQRADISQETLDRLRRIELLETAIRDLEEVTRIQNELVQRLQPLHTSITSLRDSRTHLLREMLTRVETALIALEGHHGYRNGRRGQIWYLRSLLEADEPDHAFILGALYHVMLEEAHDGTQPSLVSRRFVATRSTSLHRSDTAQSDTASRPDAILVALPAPDRQSVLPGLAADLFNRLEAGRPEQASPILIARILSDLGDLTEAWVRYDAYFRPQSAQISQTACLSTGEFCESGPSGIDASTVQPIPIASNLMHFDQTSGVPAGNSGEIDGDPTQISGEAETECASLGDTPCLPVSGLVARVENSLSDYRRTDAQRLAFRRDQSRTQSEHLGRLIQRNAALEQRYDTLLDRQQASKALIGELQSEIAAAREDLRLLSAANDLGHHALMRYVRSSLFRLEIEFSALADTLATREGLVTPGDLASGIDLFELVLTAQTEISSIKQTIEGDDPTSETRSVRIGDIQAFAVSGDHAYLILPGGDTNTTSRRSDMTDELTAEDITLLVTFAALPSGASAIIPLFERSTERHGVMISDEGRQQLARWSSCYTSGIDEIGCRTRLLP